jgi:hypothetical protein
MSSKKAVICASCTYSPDKSYYLDAGAGKAVYCVACVRKELTNPKRQKENDDRKMEAARQSRPARTGNESIVEIAVGLGDAMLEALTSGLRSSYPLHVAVFDSIEECNAKEPGSAARIQSAPRAEFLAFIRPRIEACWRKQNPLHAATECPFSFEDDLLALVWCGCESGDYYIE